MTPDNAGAAKMKNDIEFVEQRASEECGCPEVEYIINNVQLIVHVEPDGEIHALMDGGDWGECENVFTSTDFEAGVQSAIKWAVATTDGPYL